MSSSVQLLRNRFVRAILVSNLFAQCGTWVRNFAVLLYVTEKTNGDALAVSMISVAEYTPIFISRSSAVYLRIDGPLKEPSSDFAISHRSSATGHFCGKPCFGDAANRAAIYRTGYRDTHSADDGSDAAHDEYVRHIKKRAPAYDIYDLAGFCFFTGLLFVIPLLGRNHHNPSTGHAE